MRLLCSLVFLAACGEDRDPSCAQSQLSYQTFGAPFMTDWCNGCHSSMLPVSMRQQAPLGVDFDTLDEVRAQAFAIVQTTTDLQTMPPEGGPTDAERAMLADWVRCGAP